MCVCVYVCPAGFEIAISAVRFFSGHILLRRSDEYYLVSS